MIKLCECGCKGKTKIITHTNNKTGRIKGEYSRFISGHQFRGKHYIFSEEHKKKISKSHNPNSGFKKGCIPWSKGLNNETDERVKRNSELHKKENLSKETRTKMSLANKGKNNPMSGKKRTDEWKKEHSKRMSGEKNYWFGKHLSEERKQKFKEKRKLWVVPIKDTSIEIKIQNFLRQLNIEFFTHQYIKEIEHGYKCDIMIPIQNRITKKTIIECFGNYWHNYPLSREIDIKRCQELREKGWRVLVFWENEIKVMELNDLGNKVNN